MTRKELIEKIARENDLTKKFSTEILDVVLKTIKDAYIEEGLVEIKGFGRFYTLDRQPTVGRNPKDGTEIQIPARKIPKFKFTSSVKKALNQ